MKRVVLAIIKDDQDIDLWSPYFNKISPTIHMLRIEDLAETMSSLLGMDIYSPLIIISTRLYPNASPSLIEDIREWFPNSEFLLLASSSDDFPPLQPLVRDNVRHLVINPESSHLLNVDRESAQLCTAVSKLIEGKPLKIRDYLKPGTETYEFRVSSSEQKEELISGLEELISGDGPEIELLRQKGALLVDEMFENALYGAPHQKNGAFIYAKGQFRQIDARETIILRYGFDGECIAMEMEDNWGSLSPDAVLECLAVNHDSNEFCEENGGRGLFIIWRFLDHLHVHIDPGRQTVVGGQVKLLTAENLVEKKGFHITTGSTT
ncbi:MAG: ATP-binding protein [Desulfuromonadales bacterium]|nr:ATP-binding protein [Desulfuromonadales bacterium]